MAIADEAGLPSPHDRPLRTYKSARYLSHDQRALIVSHFVGETDLADLAAMVDRTRKQLLSALRRMGLPVGRGGTLRTALLAEIQRKVPSATVVEPPPKPSVVPTSPDHQATSQSGGREHTRRNPGRRIRKTRHVGPRKKANPSPAYPTARADKLLTSFVAQVGLGLDSNSLARLMTVTETVYKAAIGDYCFEKPSRGLPTLMRESLGVMWVAGVSPDGCAKIAGVSRHIIARTFCNYAGDPEWGRCNRSVWPGPLWRGFDLTEIGKSYGTQNFVFRKCLTTGLLFPVRPSETATRRMAPHVIANGHGFEGYAL